jgi:hypothetical protein
MTSVKRKGCLLFDSVPRICGMKREFRNRKTGGTSFMNCHQWISHSRIKDSKAEEK